MECIWRLRRDWQPDGDRHNADPSVFHLHIVADDGFSDYYLHGSCILAQSAQVYDSGKEKSLVLSVICDRLIRDVFRVEV
jgi:hypothetical protein